MADDPIIEDNVTVHPVELLRLAGKSEVEKSIAFRIGEALRDDIDEYLSQPPDMGARPTTADSSESQPQTVEDTGPKVQLKGRLAGLYALAKVAGKAMGESKAFQEDGTATGLRDGEFAVSRQRLVMRGLMRGFPNPPDGQGTVAIAQVDGRVWIRFEEVRIYNNPANDPVHAYLSPALSGRDVDPRLSNCARLEYEETEDGSLPPIIPTEVMIPIDSAVFPPSGFGVAKEDPDAEGKEHEPASGAGASSPTRSAKFEPFLQVGKFNSVVIAKASYTSIAGTTVPAQVFGFAPLSQESIADIESDKNSAARVSAASKQLGSPISQRGGKTAGASLERGFGDQQPASIRGKNYPALLQVARDVMAALGKNPRHGNLVFEEFKDALEGLEIKFNDAQAWSWFVEGDLDGSGRIEAEELQFILFVVSQLVPRRRTLVKDAFFMFAKPVQPSKKGSGKAKTGGTTPGERRDPGVLDLVGVLEALRALGVEAKQSAVERAFVIEDPLGSLQLDYFRFRKLFSRVAKVPKELQRLGVPRGDIPMDGTKQRQMLIEQMRKDEAIQESELREAVERAQVERSKARVRKAAKARTGAGAQAKESKDERRRQALLERERRAKAESEFRQAKELREKEERLRESLKAQTMQTRHDAAMDRLQKQKKEEKEAKEDAIRRGLDRINLCNRGLAGLPSALWTMKEAVDALQHVQVLDVSQNQIRRLPQDTLFDKLDSMVKLDASNNLLAGALPMDLFYCRGLKMLNLSGNSLDVLPEDLGQLNNLVLLNVSNNRLPRLPDSVGKLASLRALRISDNCITELPDSIGQCSQLAELDITNNRLSQLPSTLGCSTMTSLVKLWVSWNNLSKLPSRLGRCLNLADLRATNNALVALPGSLGRCRRLQTLDVSSNRIRTLPMMIGHMVALRSLVLDNNKLDSLPESIGGCASLLRLSAKHNSIQMLPRGLGKLLDLQTLDMDFNEIVSLSADIAAMQKLVHLRVAHNRLGTDKHLPALPISVGAMDGLKLLDLSYNSISEVPDQLAEMQNLERLNLSFNRFTVLGPTLCFCDRLIELIMGSNLIVEVDGAIGAMPQLKTLDLSCNRILRVPDAMGESLSLRHLNLYNNRLTLKEKLDDDRTRRHQLEAAEERDRLKAERILMEREDHRMAIYAAAGKYPHLVRWGKPERTLLGSRGRARGEPLEHPALGRTKSSNSGIIAWFSRNAPSAVEDTWAVQALLEPASTAAEEARTLRSASSARASRPGTAKSDTTLLRSSAPAVRGDILPPIHLDGAGELEHATGATSLTESSSVDRKRLSALSPITRAHVRASNAIRTDAFTIMKRHLPAPVEGTAVHCFGVGIDVHVADEGIGPEKAGPPALAAEDDYAPELVKSVPMDATEIMMGGLHLHRKMGSSSASLQSQDSGAASGGGGIGEDSGFRSPSGMPSLQLDSIRSTNGENGLDDGPKTYAGSKASWPQSDRERSKARHTQQQQALKDHDSPFTKDKRHNAQAFQNGYSVGEVLDFSMIRAAFFHHACDEWAHTGGDHMDGKLNVRDFVEEVRRRCQHKHPSTTLSDVARAAWDPKMGPLVGEFYHQVKETGVPPQYGELSDREKTTRDILVKCGQAVRQQQRDRMMAEVSRRRSAGDSLYTFDKRKLPELMRRQQRRADRLKAAKKHDDLKKTKRDMNGAMGTLETRSVLMYRKKKAMELRTVRALQREVRARLRDKAADEERKRQEAILKQALGSIEEEQDGDAGGDLATPPESVGGEYDEDSEVDSD